ncbi:MAG: riboflavin synthase [Acetatifactor sp.]|nr:riboflavin synthase [Acetatifactor sp.]
MFTGIIEEVGTVKKILRGRQSIVVTVQGGKVLEGTKIGDSIAVNGICLTVTGLQDGCFSADVMPETMQRTSLTGLSAGSHVNLERALAADGRFGGHIVSGHVDGVGKILRVQPNDNAVIYTIQTKPELMRYMVEKGSITIDGASLTLTMVGRNYFSVSLIPHTVAQTVFRERKEGDLVNLETDLFGKYVERLLTEQSVNYGKRELTKDFLLQHGF